MGPFLQATGGILVAVILWIVLSKQGKEFSLAVSVLGCCLVLILMGSYLDPVLDLVNRLEQLAGLQQEWISVMIKAVGIGLVVEIGSLICADVGNAALGKTLQITGTIVVLWLSVPLMTGLLDLLERILGEV